MALRPATWVSDPLPGRAKARGRASPNLRRRAPVYRPKPGFVLFCEGKKTEPAYFSAIRRACSGVVVEIRRGVGVPMTVARLAVDYARQSGLAPGSRKGKDSFEINDQVWAVFDRDDHPHFGEAINLCERNGVKVAWSNPCFELWLILHESDYDRPGDRRDVQKEFKALRPEYDRSGAKTPDCDDMIRRVEEAERRSDVQLREREKDGSAPFGNPSTTVGRLTRAIREADKRARPFK